MGADTLPIKKNTIKTCGTIYAGLPSIGMCWTTLMCAGDWFVGGIWKNYHAIH